jgi:hypothetical protein
MIAVACCGTCTKDAAANVPQVPPAPRLRAGCAAIFAQHQDDPDGLRQIMALLAERYPGMSREQALQAFTIMRDELDTEMEEGRSRHEREVCEGPKRRHADRLVPAHLSA